MVDQAEALRALFRERMLSSAVAGRPPRVYTIAVTSGKGGVGKTSLAVNLALLLASGGRHARLVDADFGLSNAEVLLGVNPQYTLSDVVQGRIDARDAWVDAGPGLKQLSSGSGLHEMANLDGAMGAELIGHVMGSVSDGDVVVLDTAPGINASVVSLLTLVDEVLMVTTPEPTSITDTYAAMKVLRSFAPEADVTLVTNCCTGPEQAAGVARGLEQICLRFLGRSFDRRELIPADDEVKTAVRRQSPFVVSSPRSAAANWLRKLALKLDSRIRAHQTEAERERDGVLVNAA